MKQKLFLTTALCGLAVIGAPSLAHAVITTTTTTTHSYDFPDSSPSISSSTSTANNCPPAYTGGDGDGDGDGNNKTGGGYVDTDGDGLGDTHVSDVKGEYSGPTSSTKGGTMDGNSTKKSSTALNGDEFYKYDGDHKDGKSGTVDDDDDDGGGGCFVTTAVSRVMGEPDNGPTLSSLRRLRDHYTAHTPDGARRISIYYAIAPEIVKRVDDLPDSLDIWSDTYDHWIRPISQLIKAGQWEEADSRYMQMIKAMIWQHLVLDKRPVSNDVRLVLSERLGLSWA